MGCTISQDVIDQAIVFHGHSCPGLAIGIRAAEFARREFPGAENSSLVCVTETDMCGVDGIQFLTGCTLGKGNLIHRDYGKMAFSFFDRDIGKGLRLVYAFDSKETSREDLIDQIMGADLPALFRVQKLKQGVPRTARVMAGMACAACGERTMESRTRRFDGETYCIPCFRDIDQKI